MEYNTGKPNRLQNYDYSENGAYFITICIKDMKCILSRITKSVGDGFPVPQVRLKPYGIIAKRWIESISLKYPTVFVDAYVIMPNHIHLLLRIDSYGSGNPTPTVSAVIAWLKYMISKEINRKSENKQSIWQRSFHDHIIRNEDDYLTRWQYIDENPKKWLMGKDEYYS